MAVGVHNVIMMTGSHNIYLQENEMAELVDNIYKRKNLLYETEKN